MKRRSASRTTHESVAGTFYYHGELVFWDVRHPEQTVIVSLAHERYKKLIIQVADPASVVTLLTRG